MFVYATTPPSSAIPLQSHIPPPQPAIPPIRTVPNSPRSSRGAPPERPCLTLTTEH